MLLEAVCVLSDQCEIASSTPGIHTLTHTRTHTHAHTHTHTHTHKLKHEVRIKKCSEACQLKTKFDLTLFTTDLTFVGIYSVILDFGLTLCLILDKIVQVNNMSAWKLSDVKKLLALLTSARANIQTDIRICTYVQRTNTQTHTHAYIHAHKDAQTNMHSNKHTYVCTHVFKCI